ncbi:glycoside hydrolase family 28 protein [Olivibacter ginsenosidimutans]|uniref:Glycoside hydrolase family 28 protein n=1 Tax=Olivibacter ginsenosidimutans TaxID=1176537 RepID=A0ABP9C783_9SPHI
MMKHYILYLLCSFLSLRFCLGADYKVTDFGAKPDGISVNTAIIQYAIDFIHHKGGGRLIFDAGSYVSGTVYLKSNVTLHLEKNAILLGSTQPFDYIKDPVIGWTALLFAYKQDHIGITGEGMIDGRGFTVANRVIDYVHSGLIHDPLKYDRANETMRPLNIYFRECNDVTIHGITLKDPGSWNQTYDQCVRLNVDHIKVDSKSYWNNDGIDVVDCDQVTIKNSYFDAADDAICFKSHDASKICQNVTVDNCTARSSANGLKFGTVSRGGFRNFKVSNLTVFDTYRSAITFAAVDGALIENIVVDGVTVKNTGNVLYLRIGNRWSGDKHPSMKGIYISNVHAEVPADKPDAGYNYEGPVEDLPRNISPASIVGLPEYPIQDVYLKNITISYPGGGNPFYAKVGLTDADLDSIPLMADKYPEFSQFKELPAWAFYIRYAKGIHLDNVQLHCREKDYRPAVVLDHVDGASFNKVNYKEPDAQGKKQLFVHQSEHIQQ